MARRRASAAGALTKSLSGLAPSGSGTDGVERAQIAPVMRRGFVQRRLQIVAQRGGQRRFIAGLHRHGVDQRREQAFAFGMQQIAQRLHFGGQALDFALGVFQRLARFGFGGFGVVDARLRACGSLSRAPSDCGAGGLRSGASAGAHVGRAMRRVPWLRRDGLRVAKLRRCWFRASAAASSRPRSWLALLAFQSASSAVSVSSRRSASARLSFSSRGAALRRRRCRRRALAAAACPVPRVRPRASPARLRRHGPVPVRARCRLRPGRSAGGCAGPLRGRGLPRRPAVRAATIRR